MNNVPRDFYHNFVMFSLNYPGGFIQQAFPAFQDHLQRKFDQMYDKYGANAVMTRFWVELDFQNQSYLANFITQYYSK
jgi:hypothetical protein